MTASHIYINAQGVPCAPTKEVPTFPKRIPQDEYQSLIESCIPIREEDRLTPWLVDAVIKNGKIDTFISVEEYEFQVIDRIKSFDEIDGVTLYNEPNVVKFARIIRPSEPKADPKEKELIKELAEAIKWQQLIIRALLKGTPARNTDECIAFADHAVKKAIETLNSNFA